MSAIMTRQVPQVSLDTEGNLSVGDQVKFEYSGATLTGFIAQFIRGSYLFVDANGQSRVYAHVVRQWEHRHDRRFGWFVLLTEIRAGL